LKAGKKDIPAIIAHTLANEQSNAAADAKKLSGAAANPISGYAHTLAAAEDRDLRYLFERFEFQSTTTSSRQRTNRPPRLPGEFVHQIIDVASRKEAQIRSASLKV